jgi:hypothetical protein
MGVKAFGMGMDGCAARKISEINALRIAVFEPGTYCSSSEEFALCSCG